MAVVKKKRKRPSPKKKRTVRAKVKPLTGYEANKEKARRRQAELSRSGRDIGELPPVADPERKARAERDFRFYCETYFPQTFNLAWSDDHLKVIAKIERAVLEGGLSLWPCPEGLERPAYARPRVCGA